MIIFLMFLGIALSIIKANGWIIVPTFCIVFCWVVSFVSWLAYAYAKGMGEELGKRIEMNYKKGEKDESVR